MQPILMSGKYMALLKNGWYYYIIKNDDGIFQFDSASDAGDHKKHIIQSFEKYAVEHNHPMSKVCNLTFEIKQIA